LYFVSGLGSWSAKLLFYATTAMWRICLFFSFSSFLSSREIILTGNNYELCHTNLGKKTGIENGKECQQDVEKVVFWKSSLFLKLLLYWYIVTFTKVFTIYHNWIHPLYHSPLFHLPHSWKSFNRFHFSIHIHSICRYA
jgi:hypothetical protein